MLITLCYSVLTWMQSRQRTEIVKWVEECLLANNSNSDSLEGSSSSNGPLPQQTPSCSLVFLRGAEKVKISATKDSNSYPQRSFTPQPHPPTLDEEIELSERPSSALSSSFYYSVPTVPDSVYSSAWSVSSRGSSAFSTPRREPGTPAGSEFDCSSLLRKSTSFEVGGGATQPSIISPLCLSRGGRGNNGNVKLKRLLWQEENTKALALVPKQIVELHDWTAFKALVPTTASNSVPEERDSQTFLILLEAEPGTVKRSHYRKFTAFGKIIAWRWTPDLGLILESDLSQLIDLMHIFRLGSIVLEGGWRVYRLTTIGIEGAVGTLISRPPGIDLSGIALSPAELRRLSAGISLIHTPYRPLAVVGNYFNNTNNTGIFERVALLASTNTPKHDITTIREEGSSTNGGGELSKKLPNWYERSPRKRSVANLPTFEKSNSSTPRRRSFCPGSLLSFSSGKSSSLASLVLCKQSASVDEGEEDEEEEREEFLSPLSSASSKPHTFSVPSSKSHESLSALASSTPSRMLSPTSASSANGGFGISKSVSSSPCRRIRRKSPQRRGGKPPNILILSEDKDKREQVAQILKNMLANDRYAIYDIRWDQLEVGGWSEQTALLVLVGDIPPSLDASVSGRLLQFLGDGGRLLAWCCGTPPFGPGSNASASKSSTRLLEYGQRVSHPLEIGEKLWGSFQKIVETSDSEGYSRPLTASSWGKVKDGGNETAVVLWDGGALGGKAILSQIHFEAYNKENEEQNLSLLSLILSQHLGIDCSQLKAPEYSVGYLLGDHKIVQDFLSSIPSTIQQPELTLEFVPRGERGSLPSHLKFPIRSLECPSNFSTLDYYENLETKNLGRLVIYTDTMTSTTHALQGHTLRDGLVVISRRQTTARGRRKNVWLSPEGCATFSLQLVTSMDSPVGRRLTLLQHISALSVILAVPNHKEINLRVKWPNDIYAGDDDSLQKIGGVLVETKLDGKEAIINIGIGFNVNNDYPTICLNSLLFPQEFQKEQSNQEPKKKLPKGFWNVEKLIARTLSEMEKLLDSLEQPEGLENLLQLYQDNWIHHSSEVEDDSSLVNVELSNGLYAECRIIGIDEYGFLRVSETNSGDIFSVQPDGNSFDIANKLIAIKTD